MNNNYGDIDKALNIESSIVEVEKSVEKIDSVPSKPNDIRKDYEYTRANLYSLIEQGQELPTWIGRGDGEDTSQTTILVNEKTKTWTIVQFEKGRACVLGSGVGSRPIFTGPVL